ncbi:aromatic-ring hydroxylase C-terminal domain-containing protein [Streptomyces sp. NPDC055078]
MEARRGDRRPGAGRAAGHLHRRTAPGRRGHPWLDPLPVRPDGFTAWAADAGAQAPTSTAGLAEALEEWFGVPEDTVTPG